MPRKLIDNANAGDFWVDYFGDAADTNVGLRQKIVLADEAGAAIKGGTVHAEPLVDNDGTPLPTETIQINATVNGDNTVIAGVAGKRIFVTGYVLIIKGGAGECQLKSGSGTIKGRVYAAADGQGDSYPGSIDAPAVVCGVGQPFVVNNPTSRTSVGHCSYVVKT